MTDFAERTGAIGAATALPRRRSKGQIAVKWLTTTDHKLIGHLYLITSFAFFLIGGVMALRSGPSCQAGLQIVNEEVYNQLFTMHGTIMLLLFATPLFVASPTSFMPVQIGAPDVAFPRLNMFQLLAVPVRRPDHDQRFLQPRVARPTSAGSPTRRCRTRSARRVSAVTCGIMGLWMAGLGTILGAVNS